MAEVLNMKMDNIGTPTTFLDGSPSAHTITTKDNAFQVATAINNRRQAYFFDGDSDRLQIASSSDFSVFASTSQDYTVDCLVKHTDYSGFECYIANGANASAGWYLWHHGPTNGLRFQSFDDTINLISSSVITDTNWHHVALCKVTSGGPTVEYGLYLDGVQVAYQSNTYTDATAAVLSIGAIADDTYFLDGHMKNVRISTTNVFGATPDVGKTDTIAVPTGDPVSTADTKLLLLGVTQGLDSPLNSTGYWDGTSDCYLTVPFVGGEFDYGTGDFTIEVTFRWEGAPASDYLIAFGNEFALKAQPTVSNMEVHLEGSNQTFSFSGWVTNRWYTIAATRSSGEVRVFRDGIESSTGAVTMNDNISLSVDGRIGQRSGVADYFQGWIKELAISGTARYIADYIPSFPLASDADTDLLMHFDGTPDDTAGGWIADSSGNGLTVTRNADVICKYIEDYRNNLAIDSGNTGHPGVMVGTTKLDWVTVEGNGAGYFDGSGDRLEIPNSADWQFGDLGTNDFTIALWAKTQQISIESFYYCYNDSGGMVFAYHDNDYLRFYANSTSFDGDTGFVPRLNEWYYMVAVNNGGILTFYVNGSAQAQTRDISGETIGDESASLVIGSDPTPNLEYQGWMDAFTVDDTALYTASFIPPTYSTSVVGVARSFCVFIA